MSATAERSKGAGKSAAIGRLGLFLPVTTPMCREILSYSDKYFLLTSGNAAKTRNTGQALNTVSPPCVNTSSKPQ